MARETLPNVATQNLALEDATNRIREKYRGYRAWATSRGVSWFASSAFRTTV